MFLAVFCDSAKSIFPLIIVKKKLAIGYIWTDTIKRDSATQKSLTGWCLVSSHLTWETFLCLVSTVISSLECEMFMSSVLVSFDFENRLRWVLRVGGYLMMPSLNVLDGVLNSCEGVDQNNSRDFRNLSEWRRSS